MHIVFNAQEVDYRETIGTGIIQVLFQEHPDPKVDYSKKTGNYILQSNQLAFQQIMSFHHTQQLLIGAMVRRTMVENQ